MSNMKTVCSDWHLVKQLFVCVQDYPKVSQAYYGLLEVLTQDHMDFISSLEPSVFTYLLSSISEGLTGLGRALGGGD